MTEFDDAVAELDRKIEAAEKQVENAKKGVLAKKELRDRLVAEEERYKALDILNKALMDIPMELSEKHRVSDEMDSIIANRKNRKVLYELSVDDAKEIIKKCSP